MNTVRDTIPRRRRVALRLAQLAFVLTTGTVVAVQANNSISKVPTSGPSGYLFNLFPAFYTLEVNCGRGQTIGDALRRIERNLFLTHARVEIRVRGTCNEQVEITTDHVRLTGLDGAVIDGGGPAAPLLYPAVVSVNGARGFSMSGFTVRNGPQHGVLAQRDAQVALANLTLTGHAKTGLTLENTSAGLSNIAAKDNGSLGIDIYDGSTVIASGALDGNHNQLDGITVNGNSLLELRGAAMAVNQNGGNGLLLANQSQLVIFDFPSAGPSSVLADTNGGAGLFVASSAMYVVGGTFGSGIHTVTATNNPVGMLLPFKGEVASPAATAKFVVNDNEAGLVFGDGSSGLFIGGLDASGNGIGISADGADTLTLVSVPPNPSSVVGNGHDMSVVFGSRVTVGDATIGSISCDGGLVRGSTTCP